MDNDILRVENFKDADKSVNSSHFKNDTDNNLINAKKISLSTLVKNELKDNYGLTNNAITMPKPKIFTTILLAFSLALLIVALALFCNKTKKPFFKGFLSYFLVSTINLIAVLSSPSISISLKAGTQIKSFPVGATYPLAIAIALIA